MNMRVALFLDLVTQTKGPAQEAKRDILDLKRATQDLSKSSGGSARKAKRDILDLRRATRDLGKSSGGIDAARDMERLARSAQRARREYVKMALEARKARRSMAGGIGARAGAGKKDGTAILPGTRRMLAGGVSLYALKKGFDATAGASISFEKAMADVRKKVDLPVGQTWGDLERTIVKNAIAFGRSREEVASLVAEAGAAGIAYEDLTEYTRLATRAAIGWDLSADHTAQKLAEIKAATGWTIGELSDFADKVNYLGDTSAAKEADILEMFQRAGSAAEAAGVSFDISLASLTALRSIGMRQETSSRFFNAFASKLRTATYLPKKAAAGFKMLGTNAKAVEKGMKTDALGTMLSLLERMEKSPDKAAAAIQIFGQEWWDEAARMGRAIPEIIKNLRGLQSGDWKNSLEKNLEVELSTTANHLERMKALTAEIGDRLGKWALPGINDTVEGLIKTMERLDNSAGVFERRAAEKQAEAEERKRLGLDDQKSEDGLAGDGSYYTNEQRDFQKKLAGWFTGDQNEQRVLSDVINDWAFGKQGNAKEELAEARRRGREKVRQDEDDTLLEWKRRAQYRGDIDNDLQDGNAVSRFFAQKHKDELSDLDRKVAPILRRRLAENDERLAKSRIAPAFDIGGPRIDAPVLNPSGSGKPVLNPKTMIGPGGIYQLGLGGGGPIYGPPGGKDNTAPGDYTLPKSAAERASDGVTGALGGDMSAAGQKAMSSFAAGITAGGAQAVAAANAVVGQVNAALSRAGSGAGSNFGGRLSGSLHDGATGG